MSYRVLSLDYDPSQDDHDRHIDALARIMRERPTPHSERTSVRTSNGNIITPR